jgi:hypothetical protein|tara:strand:+ start:26 stop:157 length:132 start_codon:yes stop_codon:yes gene_type:complete
MRVIPVFPFACRKSRETTLLAELRIHLIEKIKSYNSIVWEKAE